MKKMVSKSPYIFHPIAIHWQKPKFVMLLANPLLKVMKKMVAQLRYSLHQRAIHLQKSVIILVSRLVKMMKKTVAHSTFFGSQWWRGIFNWCWKQWFLAVVITKRWWARWWYWDWGYWCKWWQWYHRYHRFMLTFTANSFPV